MEGTLNNLWSWWEQGRLGVGGGRGGGCYLTLSGVGGTHTSRGARRSPAPAPNADPGHGVPGVTHSSSRILTHTSSPVSQSMCLCVCFLLSICLSVCLSVCLSFSLNTQVRAYRPIAYTVSFPLSVVHGKQTNRMDFPAHTKHQTLPCRSGDSIYLNYLQL